MDKQKGLVIALFLVNIVLSVLLVEIVLYYEEIDLLSIQILSLSMFDWFHVNTFLVIISFITGFVVFLICKIMKKYSLLKSFKYANVAYLFTFIIFLGILYFSNSIIMPYQKGIASVENPLPIHV